MICKYLPKLQIMNNGYLRSDQLPFISDFGKKRQKKLVHRNFLFDFLDIIKI